jgi:hypothetical protein
MRVIANVNSAKDEPILVRTHLHLHLDSSFVGVTAMAPLIAQRLRSATFKALDNIVALIAP